MPSPRAVPMSEWARKQYLDKYSLDRREEWPDTALRVVSHVMASLGYAPSSRECQRLVRLVEERKFIPGGRYLASAGKPYHQVNNCMLYRCEDSREGWADVVRKAVLALSSGAGIGVVYSDVRERGAVISRTGGHATGPTSPAQMVNEVARHTMHGGFRRSAIWGGLHWDHPDVFEWITIKDWTEEVRAAKAKDFNSPAPLDMTNISVILDDDFFAAYADARHPRHNQATQVYWTATAHMLRHGEPGFSVNTGADRDECLRNACTEVTSADDSDVCNLGSINMARVRDLDEFAECVRLGSLFLLAGSVYSDVPHAEVAAARQKNRRLGLGLLGVHEWLIQRGQRYEVTPELHEWLEVYAGSTHHARAYADRHGLSLPVKTRAIAPTGTIGILAETTTSAEPILAVAFKRRFLDLDGVWRYQYVLDPTADRMRREYGVDPDDLETATTLSLAPERRIRFQADLQEYVDHGISSTINLPYPVSDPLDVQEYGDVFMGELPRLRGFTCYPNGARSGQPLEAVPWAMAAGKTGVTLDEDRDAQCASGVCGA